MCEDELGKCCEFVWQECNVHTEVLLSFYWKINLDTNVFDMKNLDDQGVCAITNFRIELIVRESLCGD